MTQRGIAIIGAGMIGGAHAAAYRQFAHRFGAAGMALRCVFNFNYRRIPALAEIRARVAAAELGRPVQISVLFQCDYATDPMLPHSWRYEFVKAGPGALLEVGTHAVNLMRFMFGDVAKVVGAVSTIAIPERHLPEGATTGNGHVDRGWHPVIDRGAAGHHQPLTGRARAVPAARARRSA